MADNSDTRGIHMPQESKKRINLGRSWFLGIGINEYISYPPLKNAVKDVQDFAKLLLEEYDIEEDCTRIITDQQATREDIIGELERLINEVGAEDKVLIYYSGHGHLHPKTRRGFWIPHDAEKDDTSDFIRNGTIRTYLEDIQSLHTLLISDSCFSGSLFMDGETRGTDNALEELELKPSRWALCSGRHDEEVYDGNPGENSPFAKSIMEVLLDNQRDLLNIGKVVDRVLEMTRANYNQLPLGSPLAVAGHKWGQYVFRRLRDEEEYWAATLAGGSLQDFSNYMQKFPQGKYLPDAQRAVEALEEEEDWVQASKKHLPQAYKSFLNKFPDGYFKKPAKALLGILTTSQNKEKAPAKADDPTLTSRERSFDLENIGKENFNFEIGQLPVQPGPPQKSRAKKKEVKDTDNFFCVLLDAGHGGLDPAGNYTTGDRKLYDHQRGAFHQGSIFYEGVWNRDLVHCLQKKLEDLDIPVITISHTYEDTSLLMRAQMANRYQRNYENSLLLSMHSNASVHHRQRGLEIYGLDFKNMEEGRGFYAKAFMEAARKQFKEVIDLPEGLPASVLRPANFFMLKRTTMPALLIEHLFYDNFEDAQLLIKPETIEAFAEAHCIAIQAYQAALLL